MLKRFIFASLAFAGIIVPGAFTLALVAAPPVLPVAAQLSGCDRSLAEAANSLATMQARVAQGDRKCVTPCNSIFLKSSRRAPLVPGATTAQIRVLAWYPAEGNGAHVMPPLLR